MSQLLLQHVSSLFHFRLYSWLRRNPPWLYQWIKSRWWNNCASVQTIGQSEVYLTCEKKIWFTFFSPGRSRARRGFDGNRSRPVLPNLGRSVIPPFLLTASQTEASALWPIHQLPLPPTQHAALMPLPAEPYFIRKHQHCQWNVASLYESWYTVCNCGKPNWEENEPRRYEAGGICSMLKIIRFLDLMFYESTHTSYTFQIPSRSFEKKGVMWNLTHAYILTWMIPSGGYRGNVFHAQECKSNERPGHFFGNLTNSKSSKHPSKVFPFFILFEDSSLSWTKIKPLFAHPGCFLHIIWLWLKSADNQMCFWQASFGFGLFVFFRGGAIWSGPHGET